MTNPGAPPTGTSILAYNPFFPNGQVNDVWAAWFTALSADLGTGPVISFNGRTGIVIPVSGDYPASFVPFTQSGTGAVASTVDAKLKQSVSVVDFGADATGVSDSTTAFNNALATGKAVYVPYGTYLLTGFTITSQSFELFGDGRASILNFNTTGVGIQLTQASSAQNISGVIRDLAFKQTTNVPAAFIRNTGYLNLLIENCYFSNTSATYCVDNYLGYGLKLRNCVFSDITGSGVRLRDDGAVTYYSYVASFDGCDFTRISASGVEAEGAHALKFSNCAIESCNNGVVTNSNGGSGSTQSWGVSFDSCDFESNTTYSVDLRTDGSSYWGNAVFNACSFAGSPKVNLGSKSKAVFIACPSAGGSPVVISGSANAEAILIDSPGATQSGAFRWTNQDTGVLTLPNGTVGTPPLNFGDAATGFYRQASNKIGITANGTNIGDFGTAGWDLSAPINIFGGASQFGSAFAGGNTVFQWGSQGSGLSTASFGIGAIATSRGAFFETTAAGAINFRVGTTNILASSFDATGNFNPKFYTSSVVGGSVASASTITPTGPVFHLTGGVTTNTINLPYTGFTGSILVTTDASVTFGTSGNIAASLTTAAGQVVMFTYDGTKWYPLSINIGTTSNSVFIPQGTTAGTIDYTGATDSTTNLQALLDAAPQGTTFLLGIGTPKFNVIIRKNGVIMQGPGQAQFTGAITQYWQPFDVTKPVVQVSDDLASYNGSGVINAMLYTPSGTGQKGLVFAGGAAKCLAVNVFSLGFTKSCIEFRHDDAFPCTFNMASNIAASTNVTGAAAFMFYDRHSAFVGTGSLNTTGGGQMVITAVTSGTVCVGAPVTGTGVTGKVFVTGFVSGTNGGIGTYSVSSSQTVASTTLTLGGNAWTTANQVSNFSATAANGYQIVNDGAQTNSMSNGYVQNSFSGNGLLFTQALGALYTPRMNFGQVDVDSTTGFGAITVTVDLSAAGGSNFRTAANVSNASPIMGQINTSGGAFWVAGHTTNSATFGVAATTITLTSVAGLTAGMQIVVAGAGTSGRNYTDQIVSISGSVVTLLNHNSATSVNAGADVQFGDFAPMVNTGAVACSWNNGPVNIGTSNKNTFLGDQPGLMWHSNGGASAGPFNGTDYWTYMADKQLRFAGTVPAVTVTAISRVGTTVTVTTSGAHNMAQGDSFNLTGITDFDGFNSVNGPNATAFQPVVSGLPSTNSFAYTSPVSGGATPANQAPTLVPIKVASFNRGRLELPAGASNNNSGIAFQIPAGTYGMAFHHDNTTASFYRQTPDTTNGILDDRFGSAITTGKAWRLGNNSVGDRAYLTGNGAFWLLNAAAPGTDASGSFLYAATADNRMHVKDASGNDGAILTTTDQVGTFTTAAPTGTTSATAVMMGLGGSATLTPKNSTRVAIMASFQTANSTINDGITCDLRYGTGTAPVNGAAVTGTLLGISQTRTSLVAADRGGMVLIGIATGLTLGTAYWMDVSALAVTGGTASITGVTLTAHEI